MIIRFLLLCALTMSTPVFLLHAQMAGPAPQTNANALAPGILTANQTSAILPSSVFYRGQSATIQGRNSAGIKLADGKLILATLVDTGGYSSAIQQSYQAYLITEVPLVVGGQTLRPGAYGWGMVENNRMVVMDLGGNEVLHTTTIRDTALLHPTPLRIVAESGTTDRYRLYLGRNYVTIALAKN